MMKPDNSREIEPIAEGSAGSGPFCCGRPVQEGSPEAWTWECCGEFLPFDPALSITPSAGGFGKQEVMAASLNREAGEIAGVTESELEELERLFEGRTENNFAMGTLIAKALALLPRLIATARLALNPSPASGNASPVVHADQFPNPEAGENTPRGGGR